MTELYVVKNKNGKYFDAPYCGTVSKLKRAYLYTREELVKYFPRYIKTPGVILIPVSGLKLTRNKRSKAI